MKCEMCAIDHEGTFGSGRFCSRVCSAKSSAAKRDPSWRENISQKLKSSLKECEACKTLFHPKDKNHKACSIACSGKTRIITQEAKESIRTKMQAHAHRRYAAGDEGLGWKRRGGSSYPERYFETCFADLNFTRELRVGRWYIDFAFYDKMLAVEIDGRQHNDEDRKAKDCIKDAFLQSKGWKIIRIKWRSPNTDAGKAYLMSMIAEVKAAIAQR